MLDQINHARNHLRLYDERNHVTGRLCNHVPGKWTGKHYTAALRLLNDTLWCKPGNKFTVVCPDSCNLYSDNPAQKRTQGFCFLKIGWFKGKGRF